MDPLSITMAVLAVIGAGKGVAKTIRTLALLKDAPLSLLQLNNEVSDLSLAVSAIEEFHKEGRQLPSASTAHNYATSALEEARDVSLELETLMAEKLSKLGTKRLDRLSWMKAEPAIARMKERVRSAKFNLIAATNVLVWATTTSLDLRIRQLENTTVACLSQLPLPNKQSNRPPSRFPVETKEQQAESDVLVGPSQTRLWSSIQSLDNVIPVTGYTSKSTTLRDEVVQVLVNRQTRCSVACPCSCHSNYSARTPQLLDRAIGSIFVGYRGNPQGSIACDSKNCLKQAKQYMSSVTYTFPRWWIWQCAIAVTIAPEYQLRVLRVRSKADPVFKALSALKLRTVQQMLQEGQASVLDINEDGQSLLTWSIFCHGQSRESTQIVKMLIDAGSDTKQEDNSMMTPYTYVWTGFLRHGDHQLFTKELLDMFGSSVDLGCLGLTDLHAAILGIGTETFEDALLATTRAEIDKQDLIGMTALAWATTRSDVGAMRKLLRKGADPNRVDSHGRVTLHHWVKGGNHECLELLLNAGAEPDRPDRFGETPYLRAMYFFRNVRVQSIDLLIARGADPQRQSHEGWTALHLTARWNWNDTARLDCLLQHGLDINHMDEDGMTPLMIALVHCIPKAVGDLLERGASHLGCMKNGRSFLHIIAAFSDLATLKVLGRYQGLVSSSDPGILDHAGQTPMEIAQTRLAQRQKVEVGKEKDGLEFDEWYEMFMSLLTEPADVFFDSIG